MKKIISIFIISIFSSCGFYSFTGASISPEVKTFSVNYFPNKSNSINPALSSVFTEMLKEHFSTQTNLNETEEIGDLSFNGEITTYAIKPIAIKANETARQNRLTIKIKVNFVNKFDEKLNFISTFSRYKDYPVEENFSSVEEIYMEEICNELVEDIFNRAVVNW